MRIIPYIIPLFFWAFTFCSKPTTTDEVTSHELLWKKSGIHQYTYTLRINCFCPISVVGPHTITIVADTIVSVNGQPYQPGVTGKLPTLPELFSFIKKSDAKKPYERRVQFNEVFGYPESVYYNFIQDIADDEIGYIVTGFSKN